MVETAVLTLADTSFIAATELWMDIFALGTFFTSSPHITVFGILEAELRVIKLACSTSPTVLTATAKVEFACWFLGAWAYWGPWGSFTTLTPFDFISR